MGLRQETSGGLLPVQPISLTDFALCQPFDMENFEPAGLVAEAMEMELSVWYC